MQKSTAIESEEELRSSLIVDNDNTRIESGCYVKNQEYLSVVKEPLAVPLKHMDYQVAIAGCVAQFTLEQCYENPLNSALELEYLLPIQPEACVSSFKAIFDDHEIVGMIQEKTEARETYQKGIRQGRQMVCAQISDRCQDVMVLKIGNVAPRGKVRILINFLQQLEVSLNVFWRMSIQSHVWPRYITNGGSPMGQTKAHFNWSFKVEIDASKPIVYWNSPSHKLQQISESGDRKQVCLVLPQSEIPTTDFVLLYTTEKFDEPSLLRGCNDTSNCCLLSFIPRFSDLSFLDAERLLLAKEDYEPEMESAVGEFIFLIDRSGSMDGVRLIKAKEALTSFLRSLPLACYFNVWSFGSSFGSVFKSSERYSDKTLRQALSEVAGFSADMGGTEIAAPLKEILSRPIVKGNPRQIFLLTDGEVNNPREIMKLIGVHSNQCRVHGIGIGAGASKALLKGCADKGKGHAVFLADNEDVAGKVIQLLQASLSPTITKFDLSFDPTAVDAIIPNPQQLPCILKNEPVNLFVLLKPGFKGSTTFTMTYADSTSKTVHKRELTFEGTEHVFPFIEKMAQHRKVSLVCEALANQTQIANDALLSEVRDLRIFALDESLRHQVLCDLTAFVCVGRSLTGNVLNEQQAELVKLYADSQAEEDASHKLQMYSCLKARLNANEDDDEDQCEQKQCEAELPESCLSDKNQPENEQVLKRNRMELVFGRFVQKCETSYKTAAKSVIDKWRFIAKTDDVGQLQNSDGSWDRSNETDILKLCSISTSEFYELFETIDSDELLLTILAVRLLQTRHNTPQNKLVIKKAREWIKRQCKQGGISPEQVKLVEAKVLQKLL